MAPDIIGVWWSCDRPMSGPSIYPVNNYSNSDLSTLRKPLYQLSPLSQDKFLSMSKGHCRNVRGLGKSLVVFRLFEHPCKTKIFK